MAVIEVTLMVTGPKFTSFVVVTSAFDEPTRTGFTGRFLREPLLSELKFPFSGCAGLPEEGPTD